ncbi:PSP1-domain-containing protein [Lindgomyces ingoldianus]|uniref:PSP1-domain-containing protein n=1 Tax=Lindgomyces ingoldianus TaxID=673940 RepID=A0ACB6QEY9_9PLEO|nr:PSP1-domain-containing protein [Lindgomyces ingoldianus]KAF2465528.1 PSP1-domain-containing protein [Lindgomyces ingoldianus]
MSYKGNLSAGNLSFAEKAKVQMRRPTPDSDALASSDDEHVPPVTRPLPSNQMTATRRPSSGWLQDIQPNRKFSLPSVSLAGPGSQPTTPSLELPSQVRPSTSAFPWNTSSFTSSQGGTRLKEVLPSPTSLLPGNEKSLPSPETTEADDGIGFLLQQNPIRKSVRSQSYSVGQPDLDNPTSQFTSRLRTSLRHRPSKPSLLGESLSQLREDDFDEVESSNGSEGGLRLPPGYWEREQQKQAEHALLKQAANTRARNRAPSTSSPTPSRRVNPKTAQYLRAMTRPESDYAIDEEDDNISSMEGGSPSLTRRYSEHIGAMSTHDADAEESSAANTANAPDWLTADDGLGMVMETLGRRHSFATYGTHNTTFQTPTLANTYEEDEDATPGPSSQSLVPAIPPLDQFDAEAYFTGYGPASRAINASSISASHPNPISHQTSAGSATGNPYFIPSAYGRPARRLFVVTFKCSRADIYYLYANTGLEIRRGDLVITEGDRGCDLGQVTHADISMEDAKKFKAEANEEHFRWLVMFSQYSLAGTSTDSGMLGALARAKGFANTFDRNALTGMGAQQDQDAKPRMIKRLAQQHEITALRDKEGQEAKAKRLAATKAVEHKLPMEILDAEFQADHNKLTFFYYAESYVNFNDLVVDIFKQYKIRIWMSAVNPASVVNPAGLMQVPPPSAIGPGAILHSTAQHPSVPVGPGFGTYRSGQQQYSRATARSQAFEEQYTYPYAQPPPAYTGQNQYAIQPWSHGQYSPFPVPAGGYPGVTGSGSPMGYGGYYPPASASTGYYDPTVLAAMQNLSFN